MTTYIDPDGTVHYQRTVTFNDHYEAAQARRIIRDNIDGVIVDQTGVVPAVVIESTDETRLLIAVATANARKNV